MNQHRQGHRVDFDSGSTTWLVVETDGRATRDNRTAFLDDRRATSTSGSRTCM